MKIQKNVDKIYRNKCNDGEVNGKGSKKPGLS